MNTPVTFTRYVARARKHYECCECHGRIFPGELYEKYTGKWEEKYNPERMTQSGLFHEFKTCSVCAVARAWYYFTYGEAIAFGALWLGDFDHSGFDPKSDYFSCPLPERPHDRFKGMVDFQRTGKIKGNKYGE